MLTKSNLKKLLINSTLYSGLLYVLFNYTKYGKHVFNYRTKDNSLLVALVTGVVLAILFAILSRKRKDE
ncbi:hypothetical protein [Lacinutrix salivirga]